MKTERGLALQDLISGTYEYVETIDFKPQARVYLLDFLATTEYAPSISNLMATQLTSFSSGIGYRLVEAKKCNYLLYLELSKMLWSFPRSDILYKSDNNIPQTFFAI